MMSRLICFDLDGTLIDSAGDIAQSLNLALAEHGKGPIPLDVVTAHIGEGVVPLLKGACPHLSENEFEHLRQRFYSHYQSEMTRTTVVYEGVREFLEAWPGPIGIITNKPLQFTTPILEHLHLHRHPWTAVYGSDSWPERKPSPMPLQKMMERAGRSAQQTVMIGDGIPDMRSAQAAGVAAIAIGFGYTKLEILKTYQPRHILTHYRDLPGLLASLP